MSREDEDSVYKFAMMMSNAIIAAGQMKCLCGSGLPPVKRYHKCFCGRTFTWDSTGSIWEPMKIEIDDRK